jgi:hypothetical protein
LPTGGDENEVVSLWVKERHRKEKLRMKVEVKWQRVGGRK